MTCGHAWGGEGQLCWRVWKDCVELTYTVYGSIMCIYTVYHIMMNTTERNTKGEKRRLKSRDGLERNLCYITIAFTFIYGVMNIHLLPTKPNQTHPASFYRPS